MTIEWDGRRYISITLDWDYKRRKVHLSMPNYVIKSLKKSNHKLQKKQHQPYQSEPIIYGSKSNIPLQHQLPRSSTTRARNSFSKSVEFVYSLAEQWTALYYVQSVQSPHNQQPQHKIQCNIHNSLWITLKHKKRLCSHLTQVT